MKGKVALLLVALVAAAPACSRDAATDTRARGRIAFLAEEDNRTELRVVEAASGAVPFAIRAVSRQLPHWSPDGSRIVFVGEQGWQRGVMLVRADGSWKTERLEERPRLASPVSVSDEYPVFSPDGKSIAFASNRDGNFEIYAMDLATRTLRRLTGDPAWDSYPTWSPDGKRIAFVSGSGKSEAPHALWVIGADGSGRRKLADDVAMAHRPAWSPAGRQIVFVSTKPANAAYPANSLGVVDVESGTVRRIADYAYGNLAWSPDGARIAFIDNMYLYVVGADGSGRTELTPSGRWNSRFNSYPAWSPDGEWIAFVSGGCQSPMVPCFDTNMEVHLMRKDGSRDVKLTHGVKSATFPEWSP